MTELPDNEKREGTDKRLSDIMSRNPTIDHAFNPVEYSPSLKAYWDKVNNVIQIQDYTLESSKRLLRDILFTFVPRFQYTDANKRFLTNFVHWVWMDGLNTDFILTRGICIIGNPGSGKTKLMECLSAYTKEINRRPFKMCYTKEVTKQVEDEKDTKIMNKFNSGDWCFDELGHEKGDSRIWGNSHNLFGDCLEYRYRKPNLINHATTNVDVDPSKEINLKRIYGERVHSRMNQLWNVIYMDGIDWRAWELKQLKQEQAEARLLKSQAPEILTGIIHPSKL